MKILMIGLCSVVVPVFASNASCPTVTSIAQLTGAAGCQTFDTNFGTVSSSDVSTPEPSSSDLASSLSVSSYANVYASLTPTTESTVEPSSTASLASLAFEAFSSTSVIMPTSSSQPVYVPETTLSLTSSVIPYTYLETLLGETQSFVGDSFAPDALGAPETGSIAMIGSGLIGLGLFANSTRRRRLKRS
jgi:hypothetical protein